jgi:hypothetical protein
VLLRELGDAAGCAEVLHKLGCLAFDQNDLIRARNFLSESLLGGRSTWSTTDSLFELACVLAAESRHEAAVRLVGSVAGVREASGLPHPSAFEQGDNDRLLQTTKAAMSDDAFATEWATGWAMPIDEAVAYARQEITGKRTLLADGALAPLGMADR